MDKPSSQTKARSPRLMLVAALAVVAWLVAGPPLVPWQDEPVLGSRWLVAVIAALLVLLTAVGPTFRPLSVRQRTGLTALRLLVVLLLVLLLLRPSIVTTERKRQSATLLILLDQSRSMTLPHGPDQPTRWEVQRQALESGRQLLHKLGKQVEVKVYGYDDRLHPLQIERGEIRLPKAPEGRRTDLGSPLYEAVFNERSKRLIGVILLGDGVQTVPVGTGRVESWEAAEQLVRLDQPLYCVPLGPAEATEELRDVAMVNLPDQYTVFVKNELLVQATLQARGFQGVPIPVQLIVEQAGGTKEVVATTQVVPNNDDEQLEVQLTYTPQRPGRYQLTVQAATQEGETLITNNALSAFLTVLSGGLRVLYLEGELRVEQKFLRRSISASPDIDLDFLWIDHRLRDRWPLDLTEMLRDPRYDVFIIGDLDSRALHEKGVQEANLQALADAVGKGKGLIMLGGFHSFGAGRYGVTPLADVLPVLISKFEAQDFDRPLRTDLHVDGPLQMVPATDHFLTHLAPEEENRKLWQQLPPLDGANKFEKVKERAQVLLKSPDGVPLLVAGQYGGRVLAFAGDSTWRWWMLGHADQHRRFWRQVILWLAQRDQEARDSVWMELSQRRIDPGTAVAIKAGAKNSVGDPVADVTFETKVQMPDGTTQTIQLARSDKEHVGQFDQTLQPGTYSIRATALQKGRPIGAAMARFMVYDRDVELSTAQADHDHLARLAAQTGGRLVPAEQFSKLLEQIDAQLPSLKIRLPKKWQLGDTWQDAWLVLLAMVALLGSEWYLRKRWGLV